MFTRRPRHAMPSLALALLVALPATAHAAYIDPGTGSFVIQAIVGTALGAVFYFRQSMRAVWTMVARRRDARRDANAGTSSSDSAAR